MGLLRLLLAISVVLFHANRNGMQFVGGGIAVQSFFMISGFYMSLILDRKYTGANGSYSLFISNRLLKLYPAYWTVLLLAVLMQLSVWAITGQPILVMDLLVHFKLNWAAASFLSFANIAIFGQDLIAFIGLNKATGALYFTPHFLQTYPMVFGYLFIPQGWSLAIELMFYLIAPFILRRKLLFIIALMLLVVLLRVMLLDQWHLRYDPWIFRFFPSQLLFFLFGNVSYRLYKSKLWPLPSTPVSCWTALLLLTAATISFPYIPLSFPKIEAYYALVFLSLPVLTNMSGFFRYDALLGDLSYPVYLVHMLVLTTISTLKATVPILKDISLTTLTVIFSLLLALLINRFVVQPVNRYRQSRLRPAPGV